MGQAKARYPSVQLQVRLPWRPFMEMRRGSSNWEMAERGLPPGQMQSPLPLLPGLMLGLPYPSPPRQHLATENCQGSA